MESAVGERHHEGVTITGMAWRERKGASWFGREKKSENILMTTRNRTGMGQARRKGEKANKEIDL